MTTTILKDLTQDWIKYLKNNQIANLQSNPTTGRLSYRRQPTVGDLVKYLTSRNEFDEDEINRSIRTVISARPEKVEPKGELSTWHQTELRPGEPRPKNQLPSSSEPRSTERTLATHTGNKSQEEPQQTQKKYSNDEVEDVDFRDVERELKQIPSKQPGIEHKPAEQPKKKTRKKRQPNTQPQGQEPPSQPEQPKYKPRFKLRTKKVNEDFYDHSGTELTEKEIKQVFNILLAPKPTKEKPKKGELTPEEKELKKQEDMRKLRYLVRDVMTPAQRKTLWRILNEE